MTEKNRKKLEAKRERVWCPMDTGIKTHKNAKHPSRQENKRKLQKMIDKF